MEKLFSLNKFFLFFCAVFVLEWLALQVVGYMRLTNLGKLDAQKILGWHWPEKNAQSLIEICDTKILKRENNDAIVKIVANQIIEPINPADLKTGDINTAPSSLANNQGVPHNSQSAITLTYYRTNEQWILGKVECQ